MDRACLRLTYAINQNSLSSYPLGVRRLQEVRSTKKKLSQPSSTTYKTKLKWQEADELASDKSKMATTFDATHL